MLERFQMAEIRTPAKSSNYYIPKQKLLTARHLFLQYSEWRDEYKALSNGNISGINYDGMPHDSTVSNPTEAKAIRLDELSRKIALVVQTAIEAGENIAEWILKGVIDAFQRALQDAQEAYGIEWSEIK